MSYSKELSHLKCQKHSNETHGIQELPFRSYRMSSLGPLRQLGITLRNFFQCQTIRQNFQREYVDPENSGMKGKRSHPAPGSFRKLKYAQSFVGWLLFSFSVNRIAESLSLFAYEIIGIFLQNKRLELNLENAGTQPPGKISLSTLPSLVNLNSSQLGSVHSARSMWQVDFAPVFPGNG